MYHVCLEKGAGYISDSHVASLHYINNSGYHHTGYHQDLRHECGVACLLLCYLVPLYSSVASSLGLDGTILFSLQEHQVGHRGPAILSDEFFWFVWIQGIHCNYLVHFFLNGADSTLS